MTLKRLWVLVALLVIVGLLFVQPLFSDSDARAQIPTVDIPTVTSTPSGPMVTVKAGLGEDFVNVRSGPGGVYPRIGVLLLGQKVPAKGRSPGGEWIMIEYPGVPGGVGWVYAARVDVTPGAELPIVEPPPTVTPQTTPTIDPTLAAQLVFTPQPTRLPTFTPAPSLVVPTFTDASAPSGAAGVPAGLVIIVLLSVGILVGIFAFLQGR